MLALSTVCVSNDPPIDRAVAVLSAMAVGSVALHRAPTPEETRGLARLERRPRIVVVCAEQALADLGRPLLVVEGGPAAEDREASLLELCRRLHALRELPVAVRTPAAEDGHPSPDEIELLHSEVAAGYFHDASRGGADHLERGARRLCGAIFHPLEYEDLGGLRDALPAAAPAVVACAEDELAEALRRAGSVFRA